MKDNRLSKITISVGDNILSEKQIQNLLCRIIYEVEKGAY